MQAQRANGVQWSALILVAVLVLGVFFNVGNVLRVDNTSVEPVYPTAEEIAAKIVIPVTDNDKLNEMYDDMFIDNIKKDLAKELVLDEMDSNDFKRAVFDALELENITIDNYRDITNIVVKEIDVMLSGTDDEDATIDIEAKVYYFVDGDEDEKERAVVEVTINVNELVEDDEYKDTEVDDNYAIDVVKIYD